MSIVSDSTRSLRKIDFVEAMLKARGIVPKKSATFDEPGVLGVACMSYRCRLQSFKPAHQEYHGVGYRICGARTVRTDMRATNPRRAGHTGMTAIVPAEEASSWESEGAHEMVHFYLSARFLAELAGEIYDTDAAGVELQEAGFQVDEVVARYAMMFRDRLLEPDRMSRLELNAGAQLLGAHLLRRYSNLAGRVTPGADRKQLAALSPTQIGRVRDFIHANLARDMGLAELAGQVRLSPHYFSMRFKSTMGISPHRYVLRERVREAQQRLADGQLSISQVALSLGFADQSHFSQTFRKLTGTTPKRFQRTC